MCKEKKVANLLVDVSPGKSCSSRTSVVFSEPMKIKSVEMGGDLGILGICITMNYNLGISLPFVGMYFLVAWPQSLCPHCHSSAKLMLEAVYFLHELANGSHAWETVICTDCEEKQLGSG